MIRWAGDPLRPVSRVIRAGGGAPVGVGPSGIPAPTSSLPGWDLIKSEGFDTPVSLGNWPSDPAYRDRWRTYSPGTRDTTPGKGLYDVSRTTYVANSCLTADLHYDASLGEQLVSLQTFSTIADAASTIHSGQVYGKYEICMRANYTGSGVAGAHKVVPLLWPRDGSWPNGEYDIPEGPIKPGQTGTAFIHYVDGTPNGGQDVYSSTGLISDWNIWGVEWTPNQVQVYLNRALLGTSITAISSSEERWTLQFETEITGLKTATSATNVLTSNAHGYTNGMAGKFENVSTATGISLNTFYYVVGVTTNTFQVSATRGGSAITLGTASGITFRRWPAPDDSALVEVDWAAMWALAP